jgi:hypothetical protein
VKNEKAFKKLIAKASQRGAQRGAKNAGGMPPTQPPSTILSCSDYMYGRYAKIDAGLLLELPSLLVFSGLFRLRAPETFSPRRAPPAGWLVSVINHNFAQKNNRHH